MTLLIHQFSLWPFPDTEPRRDSLFSAPWISTLEALEREIRVLDGEEAVLSLAFTDADFRKDGYLRVNARPHHPGAMLSFSSRHGPLRYATDVFFDWRDNVRAIALGLEALRRVDRYGISRDGEQYTGWKQIESGAASAERGWTLIRRYGGIRQGLRATHPDTSGYDSARDFADVQLAREGAQADGNR